MDWPRAAIIIDKFERLARSSVRDLQELHRSIIQLDAVGDKLNAEVDRRSVRVKLDRILGELYQVLELRSKLKPDTQDQFDFRIEPIRLQIQTAVNALKTLCAKVTLESREKNIYDDLYEKSSAICSTENYLMQKHKVGSMQRRVDEVRENAKETKRLAEDVEDLNDIMVQLGQLVFEQHEVVDSIEEHIERSKLDVQLGQRNLKKAHSHQAAKYPIVAAIVGGVAVGGPVTVALGSFAAGICGAVSGAIAGIYGGRILKKKSQDAANVD